MGHVGKPILHVHVGQHAMDGGVARRHPPTISEIPARAPRVPWRNTRLRA